MTLGDKLSRLRKESNYTQEQLAEILGVSRQAVSKWESDTAYPETDKLIRIGRLFHCSLDYLLTDAADRESPAPAAAEMPPLTGRQGLWERKSERFLWGMPLWHIGRNAKGVVAVGYNASGVIAIGLKSRGVLSFGLLSAGAASFGLLSAGLVSLGLFSLGLLSAGCLAMGILAAGSISLGIFSLGSIAVGDFSVGALAVGKYAAIGDHARAMIALGKTGAAGTVFQKVGELTARESDLVKAMLDANVPSYLIWAKELIKLFL